MSQPSGLALQAGAVQAGRAALETETPPEARPATPPRRRRSGGIFFGLLVACALPGAFLGLIGAAESGLLLRPHEALPGIAAFAFVFLYFALPAAVFLGLPLLWLLRRLARESWWAFVLGGALAAVLWAALVQAPAEDPAVAGEEAATWRFLLAVALPGGLGGLGFWLTAYLSGGRRPRRAPRRPDPAPDPDPAPPL